MGFVAGRKSRLLLGDFALASYATKADVGWSLDMLDSTVFTSTSGAKEFLPGLDGSNGKVSGYYDAAEHADLAAFKSTVAQPYTFAPSGLALGAELMMIGALESQFSLGAQIAGLGTFDLTMETDGYTDFGYSLHDLTAVSADESGTSLDGAAATTLGGVAHLHVTSYSGLASAVIIVEDSANSSSWSTIGTFATVTGVTGERLALAGTIRRYTRYSIDVTGTGSITFQVGIARR